MILKPQSRDELIAQLAAACSSRGTVSRVDLSEIAGMVEHTPEDMTATVEAGMTLATVQQTFCRAGQWLPIDPPHPETLQIGDLLAYDLSGPRRAGYGTIRDYLIGMRIVLPDGTFIKSGGKVVKNVAGYDLARLFIGARHSLGIIVEATFKLRPLPEAESFAQAEAGSLEGLARLARSLADSPAEPMVLDAHNLTGAPILVAGFGGVREDVEVQMRLARAAGFVAIDPPEYWTNFWNGSPPQKTSVLPSRTVETIASINPLHYVAHLGNGIIYYRSGTPPPEQAMPVKLMERVKNTFDPDRILPNYSA